MTRGVVNLFTIDVEDYFNVSGFASSIPFADWDGFERRVERNTDRLLELLAERNVKSTFFVLGWIAERHPAMVRRICAQGHEVASHGYAHQLIYDQTREQFREDLRRSKLFLEDTLGERVIGYRAPSYSIVKDSLWALDVLMEEGFLYDSSIFPILRDRYGIPGAKRFPHFITGKNGMRLLEVPPSTYCLMNIKIPVSGGGYLRLFPYRFIRSAIRKINEKERQPAVVYLHPWEIDTGQPRLPGSLVSRFRHYVNIHKMEGHVKSLLKDFKFGPMRELQELRPLRPLKNG